jgi:hypothetical protein
MNQDLSMRLIEHQLFTEPSTLGDDGPLWPIMVKHGLQGDWAILTKLLKGKTEDSQRLMAAARSAHKKTSDLFECHRFAETIPCVFRGMSNWLTTPDKHLTPVTRLLLYPIEQVRSSLKAFNQQQVP